MFMIFNHQSMLVLFILAISFFSPIHGKFILNAETSSIIVLRHIRFPTNNEYYRIRCPYHLKHLTLTLLNYSNANCFHLYSKLINQACINYRSPCRFHAKPIQLICSNRSYSNQVDITYQCSVSPSISTNTTLANAKKKTSDINYRKEKFNISASSSPLDTITLHALSFPSTSLGLEESIGIFLIALTVVFILWFTICCVWFIRCDHIYEGNDGKCELLSFRSYDHADLIDFTILTEQPTAIVGNLSGHTNTGGIENVCLHVNPLEMSSISSEKMTQID